MNFQRARAKRDDWRHIDGDNVEYSSELARKPIRKLSKIIPTSKTKAVPKNDVPDDVLDDVPNDINNIKRIWV